MTFQRRVIALGSVAGVLLVAFILGQVFSPQRMNRVASGSPFFPGFRAADATKIEISDASSKVALTKGGGTWTISLGGTAYPASGMHIATLLDELGKLTKGSFVTRSADQAAELGVTGSEATHLVVSGANGSTLCELDAGKTSATSSGRYIRAGKSNDVYQTAEALTSYLTARQNFWEDLRVFPSDLKSEQAIRVSVRSALTLSGKKGKRTVDYTLTQTQDAQGKSSWSFGGPSSEKASSDKVKSLLDGLFAFEGNDFDTSPDAAAKVAAAPQATVVVSTSDNRDFTLQIGAWVTGDQYPCVIKGQSVTYLVPEWRIEQALAARDSLTGQ